MRITTLLGLAVLASWPCQGAEKPKIAVFEFNLVDTSPAPPSDAEMARTKRLGEQLRQALAQRYTVVDAAAEQEKLSAISIRGCNGCERDVADRLGASLIAYGWVQKVSDLILNINVVIEDAGTGKDLKAQSVDIRGNTDVSWQRGLKFLLEDRMFPSD